MAFVSASFSNRKLQDRRFTVPISLAGGTIGLADSQEAFTSTLAISSDEIFTDDRYIPSSSLPFSGSSQNGFIVSASRTDPTLAGQDDLPILKFWYRKQLTPGSTTSTPSNKKETWFFLTGSLSEVSEQIIDASQVTDFISPKFGSPAISLAFAEDNPPGYNIKVYTSTIPNPSGGDYTSVDAINYTFDYKTGVLIFNSNTAAPLSTQYVWATVYQYVGRTLRSQIEDNSIGGGGSGFPFSGSAVITGSLLISGSGTINELVVSGNVIATQGFTGSLFGTASWANNAVSASHGVTASFVNNLNQNLSITGAVVLSGSSLPELRVIGDAQFTGSVFISGGFEAQGISGSRAYLGTHIVGAVDVTGSGLIVSSSNLPSNHHNFVKIGNTELVDYNLLSISNRFFINNVDSFYVRSGGLSDGGNLVNTGLLLEHNNGIFKAYSSNNSTPLAISSASTVITSTTTGIKAAETTNLSYLLAFDAEPTSTAQNIGWVLPSKFITSTGSSAGQIISGSGNLPALAISGGLSVNGGITGSLLGTASFVVSASHALTASFINPTQFIIPELGATGSGLIISASQTSPSSVFNGIKIGNHEVLDFGNIFRINVSGSNADPTIFSDFSLTRNNNTVTGSIVNFSQNYFAFTERPSPPSSFSQGYYNFRANSTDFIVYKSESLNTDATIAFDVSRVTGKLYASGGADLSGSTNIQDNLTVGGTLSAGASTLNSLTVSNTTTLNGNLVVNGTASFFGTSSFINVQNLAIEDKFILLNSGSKGTPSHEGGIIIQTSASAGDAFGTAIFYDQNANRWMVARSSSVAANTTSITVGATTDYIVTVSASSGAPTGTPVNFGTGDDNYSVGQMYIRTDGDRDIYIYA
jgi:hypothetical protein